MEEIWKPIKGYENYYEVSNLGKVRGLRRLIKYKCGRPYIQEGREKVPQKRATGYLFVRLFKDGEEKAFSIHRLVAEAFIDNPNGYPVVNHKGESRTNNVVSNLEWCTHSYNSTYGNARKGCEESHRKPVIQETLDGQYVASYRSLTDAAIAVGRKDGSHNIGSVCSGKHYSAYGYKWKFKEKDK